MHQASFNLRPKPHVKKTFFGPPSGALVVPFFVLLSVNNSGAYFSVSNAEFEGGGDGHGHDDRIFLEE